MQRVFYPSGELYSEKDETCRRYYYPDGTLKTVEFYREGKLEGEILLYWPNGALKRRCFFCAGVRHGVDQMWSDAGQLLDEGNYHEGKSIGV